MNKKITAEYNQNPVQVGKVHRFPEPEDRLQCPASGIFSSPSGERVLTDFTGDRVRSLKNLAAHMIKQAEEYNNADNAIYLADCAVSQLGKTKSEMPEAVKDYAIQTLKDKQAIDAVVRKDSYNALIALFALLLLDFNDLSQDQKMMFLLFLNSQRRSVVGDLTPTDIIDSDREYYKNKMFTGTDHLGSYGQFTGRSKIAMTYLGLSQDTAHEKFLLSMTEGNLHSQNLKAIDLPDRYKITWPFAQLESNPTPEPWAGTVTNEYFWSHYHSPWERNRDLHEGV